MKLCILFPGIGYHCDKPLLYYSRKAALAAGYEVISLRYSGFPTGAKGNGELMRAAAEHALEQSEEQLSGIGFSEYSRILLIGKSIGTAACAAFRELHGLDADCILLTPLALTFEHDVSRSIAFHGTADPWADTAEIERLCNDNSLPLHKYPSADHSLETGEPLKDISFLTDVMQIISNRL